MKSRDINVALAIGSTALLSIATYQETLITAQRLNSGNYNPTAATALIGSLTILILYLYIQLRTICISIFSFLFDIQNRATQKSSTKHEYHVSIIVPAYNESDNIKFTLDSIIKSTYPNFEVIVIDDGSSDTTYKEVKDYIYKRKSSNIRLITKQNKGKWDAINIGLKHASHEYILLMDADSRLHRDSIQEGINSLIKNKADVICGHILVANTRTLICKLQALEYTLTNCIRRRAQSYFKNVLIVPGPFGLYKKAVLSEITSSICSRNGDKTSGPVSPDTFAEDCDLTINALCLGFKVHYESNAKVSTKAPENLVLLANQRYRWNRGHMQVSKKYLSAIKNATIPIPFVSLMWLINTLVVDSIFLPALFFGATIFGVYLFLSGSVGQFLPQMALAMVGIELNIVIYSTQCEHDPARHIPYSVLLPFYRIILLTSWITAAFDEARSSKMSW